MKRDRMKDAVYFHCILTSKTLYTEITSQFFEGSPLQYIYEIAREYAIKYDQAPTESDLYSYVDRLDMEQEEKDLKYDKDRIHVLYTRTDEISLYGRDALEDEVRAISRWTALQGCLGMAATEFRLLDDQVSPDNIDQAVDKIFAAISDRHLPSFSSEEEPIVDFWDPASHNSEHVEHWKTGYEFLDTCLDGGYWPGSLHLLLGAPKVGKSMWLCNLAVRSAMAGNDTAYITLEMPAHMLNARLTPNLANIPLSEYKRIRDNKEEVGRYLSTARKKNAVVPGRLDIISYPTNSLSAERLAARIAEEEEKRSTPDKPFHYKNIFIDYLSIMISSLKDKSNMYLDGKRKAEEVRSQAQIHKWCIVSAVQTNRAQYGTSDIDETQVSESSGYNATVDSMFGIVRDEIMAAAGQYRLKNIYDRVAPCQGDSKIFTFDMTYLRINEVGDVIHSSDSVAIKMAIKNDASVKYALSNGDSLRTQCRAGVMPASVVSGATTMVGVEDSQAPIEYSQEITSDPLPQQEPEMDFAQTTYEEPARQEPDPSILPDNKRAAQITTFVMPASPVKRQTYIDSMSTRLANSKQ